MTQPTRHVVSITSRSLVYFHGLDRDSLPSCTARVSNHLRKATHETELLNTESKPWNVAFMQPAETVALEKVHAKLPYQRTMWTVAMAGRFWWQLCPLGELQGASVQTRVEAAKQERPWGEAFLILCFLVARYMMQSGLDNHHLICWLSWKNSSNCHGTKKDCQLLRQMGGTGFHLWRLGHAWWTWVRFGVKTHT